MSLLLCRQENAVRPYYMEELGIHIYTSQELCYIIYNHPFLTLDGFVDEQLTEFIKDQLNMPFLAAKLEKWEKSGEDKDEMLIMILQEVFYYTSEEINKYRHQISAMRKLHPAQYGKEKADYLFRLKQYGRAIQQYEKALEFPRDQAVKDEFLGKVWCNLGSAYARMFRTEKAMQSYEKAYSYLKDENVIQKMYYMTLFNKNLKLKERCRQMVTEELENKWKKELSEAENEAGWSERLRNFELLMEKDQVQRLDGAAKMVERWKQEYRTMV